MQRKNQKTKNPIEHKIDWLNMPGYKGETWNPVIGCTKISNGCRECYAEKMARRLASIALAKYNDEDFDLSGIGNYAEITLNGKWNGQTRLVPNALSKPLHWRDPRMIFVCSMSDLFHETVDCDWIDKIIQTVISCPQHIFIFLTKRDGGMREYFNYLYGSDNPYMEHMPIPNLWLGVTVEEQKHAPRIDNLLQIPASVHFVSIEPMLGEIDLLKEYPVGKGSVAYGALLDWVICGGESGHNARPMHPDWVRNIRDQCKEAGTPFFFKQWGEYLPEQLACVNGPFMIQGQIKVASWHHLTIEGKTVGFDQCSRDDNYNDRDYWMAKVGKHQSGSELDGRFYKEFPTLNKNK